MRVAAPTATLWERLGAGALAGLAGGLVFGAAMVELGVLPTVASLVRADSSVVGFVIHMLIAAVVGAGFGALMGRQRPGTGETLFWGLTYGAFWWFLGPLTLLPLLLGEGLAWDVPSAQDAFPSLFGHLLYGATLALPLAVLSRERPAWPSTGALLRGASAGLCAAWPIGLLLAAQDRLALVTGQNDDAAGIAGWLTVLLLGALAGLGYALLYPRPASLAGTRLVRGMVYGFFWWVLVTRTVLPLLRGDGLPWSVAEVRMEFAPLIGGMLFGALLAITYGWLDGLWRLLFADQFDEQEEGAGAQGLRAVGRGVVAGVIGGLLFTLVMVQVGFLPTVASLIGAGSATTGLIVHLVISILIGAAYGLLFRRQSFDAGSALGWGVSYGFFWWLLGPLTLLPLLLGRAPEWTAAVAGGLIASLVGHIAYGAGMGVVFYRLEARYSPWWLPRTAVEQQRVKRRKEQLLTAAPALWALALVIALTLPVVLAG